MGVWLLRIFGEFLARLFGFFFEEGGGGGVGGLGFRGLRLRGFRALGGSRVQRASGGS